MQRYSAKSSVGSQNSFKGPSTSTPITVGCSQLKKQNSSAEGSAFDHLISQNSVESSKEPTSGIVQKNPEWYSLRPFLSLDFPCGPYPKSQASPLGNLSAEEQERILVQELLCCLNGFDGDFIVAASLQSEVDERTFQIDESAEYHLKEMVQRFFPILNSFSFIQRFEDTRSGFDHGMVNGALAAAVGNFIQDYRIFLCQLEDLMLKSELDLLKAWYLLQPNRVSLHKLHHVLMSLMKVRAHGGQILSILHQHTGETMGNKHQHGLLLELTRSAAKPYWNILQKWIYQGTVEDPYEEFMVEDHQQVISMDKLSLTAYVTYSDDYWEKRFTLRRDWMPSFLLPLSDLILRTGKYVNVIKQCGIKLKLPQADHLVYTLDGSGYKKPIENAYNYASKSLLEVLMKDYDLIGRFKSVKHYFFLNAGDFISQFLSLCGDELIKNVDDVRPSRLKSLLELALRTTSIANADPYKDDLDFELLSYDLASQMVRILSIQDQVERIEGNASSNPPDAHQHLTGLDAFSFIYRVRWPLSLVFNTEVMARYQMIFRQLFVVKSVENLLGQVYKSVKTVRNYSFSACQWHKNALTLSHRMLHFIQNMLYYITADILEPLWDKFMKKIGMVDTVDQVISAHMEFLNLCMKESMLTDTFLLQTVTKLVKLCENFSHFILKIHRNANAAEMGLNRLANNAMSLNDMPLFSPDDVFLPVNNLIFINFDIIASNQMNVDTFDKNVARMEVQFNKLLVDVLHMITAIGNESYDCQMLTLVKRLDFNSYYTKTVGQLLLEKLDKRTHFTLEKSENPVHDEK